MSFLRSSARICSYAHRSSTVEHLEQRRLLSTATLASSHEVSANVCTCTACTGLRLSSAINADLTPSAIPTSKQKLAMRNALKAAVSDAADIALASAIQPIERFTRTSTINEAAIQPTTSMGVRIDMGIATRDLADGTKNGRSLTVALPAPDGSLQQFNITRSSTLSAGLAAQRPDLLTFSGTAVDDPNVSIAMDLTTLGLHASVAGSADGDWYLDPYFHLGTSQYISYYLKDLPGGRSFECLTEHDHAEDVHTTTLQRGGSGDISLGTQLRVYDLVVATTGEYTAYHGGVTNALSAVTTVVTRLNQIYERDLSVRFSLVPQTSSFIYPTASTDPFTSANSASASNNVAQNLFDSATLGSANYDVGHVFHKAPSSSSNNGLAGGIGTVGQAGVKGKGYSALFQPVGDFFSVDYVAHELGHQFGGRHSFSSADGGPGDSTSLAVEPGSGSTIMSYAGIGTSAENLQANADAMFHSQTIEQIHTYLSGSIPTNAATLINTGNTAPSVAGGTTYRIPVGTPFALTASATDDGGAANLTYSWEQRNGGSGITATPTGTGTSGPLFRTRLPVASPTRMFPALSSILNGSPGLSGTGEKLSTVGRTLNLAVAVRDGQGGVTTTNTAMTSVVVVSSGVSAFLMTSNNSAATLTGGSNTTLTWNVGGTTANTINVANVKISMSTDNGQTWAYTLAESTANDGSEAVTLPYNVGSTQVRFKVEAIGNIFFDINNAAQTLVNTPIPTPSATPGVPLLNAASDTGVSSTDGLTNKNNGTLGNALAVIVPDTIAGAIVDVLVDGVVRGSATASGTSTPVSLGGTFLLTDGAHTITARQTEAGKTVSALSTAGTITIDTAAPAIPTLLALDAASDSGVDNNDNLTNVTSPTFAFATSETYARLSRDGVLVSSEYDTATTFADTGLSDGSYAYALTSVDAAGNVSEAISLTITIDTIAPALLEPGRFEFEVQQALRFMFAEDVAATIEGATFMVETLAGDPVIAPLAYDPLTFTSFITFPTPLADSDYVARLTGVTDLAGNTMADQQVDFFWLQGDANRDRVVNFDDLLILAQNYGTTERTYTTGNFNYDEEGAVNFDDLLILAQQYGKSLPPIEPLKPAAARKRPEPAAL